MAKFGVRLALALAIVVGLLATMTELSYAQFVLYDDFDSGFIDPDKWAGGSGDGTFAGPAEEVIRQVENGQLRLSLISYGNTASNSDGVFSQRSLSAKQLGVPGGSGFITGMRAQVTVLEAKAQACAANPHPENTAPRVELAGRFFNDGSSSGPSDQTGDVQVFVIVVLDGFGNRRINAGLQHCVNPTCQGAVGIGGAQFTATWATNTPMTVSLAWKQAGGRFRFTVNGEIRDVFYPVGITAAGPPVRDFKQVTVRNFVENCTAKQRKAKMDALIDNVEFIRQP